MRNIASPKRTKHRSADGRFLNLLMDTSERRNGRVDPKTTSERGATKSPVSVLSGFKYILKSNTVRSLLPWGNRQTFKTGTEWNQRAGHFHSFTPESARAPRLWGGVVFDSNPTGLQRLWTCRNLLFKLPKEPNVLLTNEFLTSVSVDVWELFSSVLHLCLEGQFATMQPKPTLWNCTTKEVTSRASISQQVH